MKILEVTNLSKTYGTGETQVKALDNVSLSVESGEFVAIIGPSGSGKSTLLHIINGVDISNLDETALAIFRRRQIGLIYQFYNLIPILTVKENLTLPLLLDGRKPDERVVDDLLKTLGLTERVNHLPNQLSGGQQQRVGIARAFVSKPRVIFADEPTGNLDSKTSADVLGLLKTTSQKFHQTLVMITHNSEIAQLADRIIRIEDGKIVQ